ncbi:coat protein [Diatom colony associated dsRNA virus 4 genome type B]|uniref:coat protein n=1 Tax=Diatom colony associated dsRNA virus 4 genome type B TaxID=1678163 RepID=UPI0007A66E78|nr:coat protein [Diatom colony associated dsRNA virus 4 genome type B]BAU79489.1 coat protein [Diatom colony associated dsRNA virus 4 genome type B]
MLLNSVQSREFLKKAAFAMVPGKDGKADPSKADFRRLWLHSTHHVSAQMCGRTKTGHASVWYGIEYSRKRVDPKYSLTIDDSIPAVASQSLSTIMSTLKTLGARHALSGTSEYDCPFDMRALGFICGFVSAATSAGVDPLLNDKSAIKPLTANTAIHLGTCASFSETCFSNQDELVSLTYLTGATGLKSIRLATQTASSTGRCLKGEALGVYALKLYANLLAESHYVSSSAYLAEAKFSGELAFYKILGHSHEGSGVRQALINRSYPTPVGFVNPVATNIQGLSTVASLHTSDLLRHVVASVLSGVGRIARSDPTRNEEGLPTIYRPNSSTGKPSSMPGFEFDYYQMLANWRTKIAKEEGLADSDYKDGMSSRRYFDDDEDNDHYKRKAVVPFFYVEPGPVSTSLDSSITMLGCQGEGVSVPLVEKAEGYKTLAYGEYNGTPFPGSVVRLVTKEGYAARRSGINYLMSGRYSRGNGLSQFHQVSFSASGIFTNDMAMSGDPAGSLSDRRWHTYHCPLPNPGENFTNKSACFSYTYSGGTVEPSLNEFISTKVDSLFGTLIVGTPGTRDASYHRDIPDHLSDLVSMTAGVFTFLTSKSNVVDMASRVGPEGGSFAPVSLPEAPARLTLADVGATEELDRDDEPEEPVELGEEEQNELPEGSTNLRPDVTSGPAAPGS